MDDQAPAKPNFQARIANALLVGFGGLVFLAVAAVLRDPEKNHAIETHAGNTVRPVAPRAEGALVSQG